MTTFIVELATLGNIGYSFSTPGAIGAMLGVFWFWLLFITFRSRVWIAVLIQIFIAIGVATVAEDYLVIKDASAIIIDEFVAVGLIFLAIKPSRDYVSIILFIIAFLLFLVFDGLKPLGITYIELLPAGLGIVADDVVAALLARGFLFVMKEKLNN